MGKSFTAENFPAKVAQLVERREFEPRLSLSVFHNPSFPARSVRRAAADP